MLLNELYKLAICFDNFSAIFSPFQLPNLKSTQACSATVPCGSSFLLVGRYFKFKYLILI